MLYTLYGAELVAGETALNGPVGIGLRDHILHPNHRLDDVVDIGEVALHFAVVVNVDTFSFQHRFRELEQRHIRATPRTINRKEAQPGGRDAVQVNRCAPSAH